MPADLELFNRTYLLIHWKSKRKATWLVPLHQACLLTLWNFISQDCYIVNTTYMPCRELLCRCSCNIYACWPSITITNTAAYSNMPTGWVLLQDGCLLDCGHSISMPADLLSLKITCLLALCFSICYTCWYGVSLSAVSAGMVTCLISFAPVFSFIYCWVLIFALSPCYILIYRF